MEVLTKIVRNFDIVAVQEFRDKSEMTLPYFVKEINELSGDEYKYVDSIRLGRTSSKEKYAFIYNTVTVSFNNFSYVYSDSDDVFEREPFIAYFSSGDFDFVLINIHTKPGDATTEINAFRDNLLDRLEVLRAKRKRSSFGGPEIRMHDERESLCLLSAGLKQLGLTSKTLESLPKGAPEKKA
ncbi:MAG: hypothetical protein GY797_35920, partial [Deltaproteobacteria bacterium]|nr:hypothetical protein [Deltaproteobacteria bacterium]